MIRALVMVLLMMSANISFANAKLGAVIEKNQAYTDEYALSGIDEFFHKAESYTKIYFPEKKYDIYEMSLTGLKWGILNNKQNLPAVFSAYYQVMAKGDLKLVSYDEASGKYKFLLTLRPSAIIDDEYTIVSGPKVTPIKGKITFNDNNKEEIYIEGTAHIVNGKLQLTNQHSDIKDGSFELRMDEYNTLLLKQLRDLPVTVEIEG
jgi:hypothetical protein